MARKALERLEAGLPAAWYYEPEHYRRELDAFWYRRWIAACREEELPAAGDWRVVAIGSQKIVLLRNENGELRAFHNTCRHRGSILCEKESGRFARARIVCPYHAWTYDLDGHLVGTPRRMETLLVEHFAECFHCPPVHPELCRVVTAYQDAGAWGLGKRAEDKTEYKPGARTLTLDGTSRLPAFERLTEEERKTLYVPAMLPPNLFLNVHPDYVNSHMMFPTGPESVRIVYDWLFEPRHLPLAEADLQHYVALWEVTNAQDARNCGWQQQGIHALPFEHGHYVPQEFDAHRFAQWVRQGLTVSGKTASRPRRARKAGR
jgi:phenylpropionate dioxygenase-like ring-hydroxylating dioxygenase large terminal subunit